MCSELDCGSVESVASAANLGWQRAGYHRFRWTKDQYAGLLQPNSFSLCVSPHFEAVDSGPILVIEWCPGVGAVSVNRLRHSQTRVKHGLVARISEPGDERTQGMPKGDSGTGSDQDRMWCRPLFFGPVDTMSIWN